MAGFVRRRKKCVSKGCNDSFLAFNMQISDVLIAMAIIIA